MFPLKMCARVVLFVIPVYFTTTLLWNWTIGHERNPAETNFLKEFDFKLRDLSTELRPIRTAVEEIKDKISKLETWKKREFRVENVSHLYREPSLPSWIEKFAAPRWSSFKPWRGVFVFFVNYRHGYLRDCLASIAKASADIDGSSVCVFALDKPRAVTTRAEINKTIEVLNNVTFCKVYIWKVDSDEGRAAEKNMALRLKHHWWFVLESVFNATMAGNYCGVDVCLILHSNCIAARTEYITSGVPLLTLHT